MDLYTVSPESYDEMRENIIQLLVSKEMEIIKPALARIIDIYEPGHCRAFRNLRRVLEHTLRQMIARQPDITLMNEYEKLPF